TGPTGITGPNIPATFANVAFQGTQIVDVFTPIVFNVTQNISNMTFTNNTSEVIVNDPGVYKIEYFVTTATTNIPPIQFTFFVNGILSVTSSMGIVTAGGEVSNTIFRTLNTGDTIEVFNTSGTPITIPAIVVESNLRQSARISVHRIF
ncbi:BclA C-terminal domain-containing protein, partial [Bacillus mycoides]|uniref:BclA C-terminal domain-containing protein n=1 Tax=Bacillus mycoides TaxID=1405 RepID=UPI001485C04E